jgi:hypothetical protein
MKPERKRELAEKVVKRLFTSNANPTAIVEYAFLAIECEVRETVLDEVLRGLASEDDSTQLRAIIASIRALKSAPAIREEAWISVSEKVPDPREGKVLVTNNIKARDTYGNMSHVWLVRMIHDGSDEFGWFAFDDYDNRVPQHITHWTRPAAIQRANDQS